MDKNRWTHSNYMRRKMRSWVRGLEGGKTEREKEREEEEEEEEVVNGGQRLSGWIPQLVRSSRFTHQNPIVLSLSLAMPHSPRYALFSLTLWPFHFQRSGPERANTHRNFDKRRSKETNDRITLPKCVCFLFPGPASWRPWDWIYSKAITKPTNHRNLSVKCVLPWFLC